MAETVTLRSHFCLLARPGSIQYYHGCIISLCALAPGHVPVTRRLVQVANDLSGRVQSESLDPCKPSPSHFPMVPLSFPRLRQHCVPQQAN